MKSLIQLLFLVVFSQSVHADVVKPALVEINVNNEREVMVELRASIEALLTGINARYQNTQEAPTAEEYDQYREMSPRDLAVAFEHFKTELIDSIILKAGDQRIDLFIDSVDIPARGYTKVPRISVIRLSGRIPEEANFLQWYYPEKFGDNAVRLRQVNPAAEQWHWSQWQWLRKDNMSEPFSLTEIVAKPGLFEVVIDYIIIGFEHIVPKGLDHILFIIGLFLLSTRWSPLLWQVTMFTIAHTITLALAMNNIVELPARLVEPLIALSIAYVGFENLMAASLHRSRLVLVFLFGLLHGLGFAGVLSDFGMPVNDFATALISFNIGVELGQITVIIMAWLAFRIWFNDLQQYRKIVVIPGSIFISLIGLYWVIERLELI